MVTHPLHRAARQHLDDHASEAMNAPPRVENVESFWTEPPPARSPRCKWWVARIERGLWRPNRRLRSMGYHESADFFGVYIWEYLNVLSPMLLERR